MHQGEHRASKQDRWRPRREPVAAVAVLAACASGCTAVGAAAPDPSSEFGRWLAVAAVAGVLYALARRSVRRARAQVDEGSAPHRRVRMLVLAFVAVLLATILGNLYFSLRSSRDAALATAQRHDADLATLLAQELGSTFDAIELALDVVARSGLLQSTRESDRATAGELLRGAQANLPLAGALWATDASGRLVAASGPIPPPDRYLPTTWRSATTGPGARVLYLGVPRTAANGVRYLPVARRLDTDDGRFAGLVVAAIRLDRVRGLAHGMALGRDGFFALARTDGVPLVVTDTTGRRLDRDPPLLRPGAPAIRALARSDAGSVRDDAMADGVVRLLSYRRVQDRPLTAIVAVGEEEVLAPWRDTAMAYLVGSLTFLALITLLALRLLRALDRLRGQQTRIARLSRMHAVLSGVNALIVRTGSRQSLFDGACRVAVDQGGFDVAWIDGVDAQGARLAPAAWAGANAACILGVDLAPLQVGGPSGLAGEAVLRHAAVGNDDLSREPRPGPREQRAAALGYRSAYALPLFHRNEVVATLTLLAHPPGHFDAEEVRLLDDLAGDLSYALEHLATVERLDYLARYDALTGLPNRVLLLERMAVALQLACESGGVCALVKIDLERFRQINHIAGWEAGDRLLRDIGERLRGVLGEKTLLARTERDHFVFLLTGLRSPLDAAPAIRLRIQAGFADPLQVGGRVLHLSARAGVALYPADGTDAATLLRNAEAALARAKHRAERLVFYTATMNARAAEALAVENRLRTALERRQFVLHYQPKYDARSGRIVGLEALIRWNDPAQGLMPPSGFIGLLEETGLILEVGEWVMQQAVRDQRRWRRQGLRAPRVAVNVSAIQLRQEGFANSVRNALDGDLGSDHGLELEITESMLMSGLESNADKLDAVRGMGVRIAIDDFGTGYSSLQYIAKLPLDMLKIDRSFVTGMTRNDTDREIVASVISLAHQLHLKVVAEGVEADEQAELLRELHCDEMQGYLFSPPLPAEHIATLLRGGNATPDAARRLH